MDVVTNYFIELKKAVEFVEGMNGHKLLPNEMLNLDETGFDLSNCSKTMRVIIRTTKFKRQPKAAHQGFESYIDFLLDSTNGGIPNDGVWRILVVDGYGSHTMVPSVLQKLRNRNIVCLSMPSHTSHALQPLDVSCFRPTKYFWSWSLRYITGIGKICDITMYQAPYYFEVALLNGCTLRTIQNGFRTTGLYPFNPNWAEDNKDKFALAETLDIDKMNAKISAPDADLSFSHSYQLFEKRSENLGKAFEEFGANIQDQFPQLCNSVKEMLDSRVVQGSKLKEAALVFNLPENTKVKKVGQARLNVIGETFGAPRVLNSTERIQKLIEYRKVAQAHNRERQQKIADDKAKSAAKKARIAQQKRALAEKHGPVLAWLKVKKNKNKQNAHAGCISEYERTNHQSCKSWR